MIEREDLLDLVGWDVLEVGLRQAWPFITFGAPTPEREERRLFIDADFSMTAASGESVEGTALVRLEPLTLRIVEEIQLAAELLTLRFDDGVVLTVSSLANPDTVGPPWWIGGEN